MMGGYLQDKLVQGGSDPTFYRLWHWDQIDVFIYFSHSFITIPPSGWVAAAHRNGCQVLGTFITEWADGAQTCKELFATRESAQLAADQLVAIAVHHGFEGWLINIENGLPCALVPNLVHFVSHLRARMAAAVPHSLVMWYDAVTIEGELAWQSDLTPLNYPFFDAADALFLDYKWREGTPAHVAQAAGAARATTVYMGVDVFGRGTYGGGGDNCPLALSAARQAGVSAALFAPGWVYENFDKAEFEARQEVFWAKIRSVWQPRPAGLPASLPLATCFNRGCGRHTWLEGRLVSEAPWYNLSATDALPRLTPPLPLPPPRQPGTAQQQQPALHVALSPAVAYNGGTSLAVSGTMEAGRVEVHTLYTCAIPLPASGLNVSLVASPLSFTAAVRAAAALGGGGVGAGGSSGTAPAVALALVLWLDGGALNAADTGNGQQAVSMVSSSPSRRRLGQALGQNAVAVLLGAEQGSGSGGGGGSSGGGAFDRDAAAAQLLAASGFNVRVAPGGPAGSAHGSVVSLKPAGAGAGGASSCGPSLQQQQQQGAGGSSSGAGSSKGGRVRVSPAWLRHTAALSVSEDLLGARLITGIGLVACACAPPAPAGSSSSSGWGLGRLSAAAAAAAAAPAASSFECLIGQLVIKAPAMQPPALPRAASASPPAALTPTPTPSLAPSPSPLSSLPDPGSAVPGTTTADTSASSSAPGKGSSSGGGRGRIGVSQQQPLLSGLTLHHVTWTRHTPSTSSTAGPAAAAAGSSGGSSGASSGVSSGMGGGSVVVDGVRKDGGSVLSVVSASSEAGSGDDDLLAEPDPADVAVLEEEVDAAAAGGPLLLSCELSWLPHFEGGTGAPRHRSYHVWAHLRGADVGLALQQGSAAAAAAGGRGGGGEGSMSRVVAVAAAVSDEGDEGPWEVVSSMREAVWLGEAFVARYRVVRLEVPVGVTSVTLLVQGVTADGEVQPLQVAANIPVSADLTV